MKLSLSVLVEGVGIQPPGCYVRLLLCAVMEFFA